MECDYASPVALSVAVSLLPSEGRALGNELVRLVGLTGRLGRGTAGLVAWRGRFLGCLPYAVMRHA